MKFKVGDKVRIVNTNVDSSFPEFKGTVGVIKEIEPRYSYPYLVRFKKSNGVDTFIWSNVEVYNEEKIVITTDGKTTTATKYYSENGTPMTTVATAVCSPEDTFDFNTGAKLAMERLMEIVDPVIVNGFKVGDRVNFESYNGTVICIAYDDDLGVEFDEINPKSCCHSCDGIFLKAGKTGRHGYCRWINSKFLKHGEAPKYYNGKVVCVNLNGTNRYHYTVGKIYKFVDGTFIADDGGEVHEFNLGVRFKSFKEWNDFSSSEWLEIKE